MKNVFLTFAILTMISVQYSRGNTLNYMVVGENLAGCEDADETILNILSLFINDPGFGFFGCADIIPYLESQSIIPLNCNTNLTPFGYFNMTLADICECSCQEYIQLENFNISNRKLINSFSIIGAIDDYAELKINVYSDGYVQKIYIVK